MTLRTRFTDLEFTQIILVMYNCKKRGVVAEQLLIDKYAKADLKACEDADTTLIRKIERMNSDERAYFDNLLNEIIADPEFCSKYDAYYDSLGADWDEDSEDYEDPCDYYDIWYDYLMDAYNEKICKICYDDEDDWE